MIDRKKAKQQGIWIGNFLIKVSPDDMFLFLEGDFKDPDLIKDLQENWENLKIQLKKEGFFGILPEPELIDNKLILAKGTPPQPPTPERFEFFEKFLPLLDRDSERKWEELAEKKEQLEKEDLRESCQKIICAEKDEPIAKWFPSIPGTPGVNIWGDSIDPPSLPKKSQFSLGNNLYLEDNSQLIKAKKSGVVVIEKDKIEIYPEYTIKGDIDFSVGNVYFTGTKLTIEGDIKFGFKVICKGILELKGCTENKVYIEVNKDFICDGVVRGEETKVKVKGQAELKGVEYANLEIEGNLIIKNYLIFSKTLVFGDLKAISGKGIIYGGIVKVLGNIEVKILGNEAQTTTKVLAGYNPWLIEPYLKLVREKSLLKESLEKLSHGIMLGEKLKKEGCLTPEKEKIWLKIQEEYDKLTQQLQNTKEKIIEIKKEIDKFKSRIIKVIDKVYPGVTIGITEIVYTIPEEKKGPITFYLESDIIQEKT